ncbi:unknown protein [Microcystis aeruginosa NIES-843]|uniref:Uncharacterized protein n=1 Tax=Microcystis aeruginosa (strain NIES-843 / IAM M-2473) TaxID=449447 RepID=B0JUC6_MICAN|nr:unknown protein [Microcystis aeruginosa NIES-843]
MLRIFKKREECCSMIDIGARLHPLSQQDQLGSSFSLIFTIAPSRSIPVSTGGQVLLELTFLPKLPRRHCKNS